MFLISSAGFQSGAQEAAAYSNVKLVTWFEFQQLFAERWYQAFMAPTLVKEGNALREYTEPINSRIDRKANALSPDRFERFRQLQGRYADPSISLWLIWFKPFSNNRL